MRRIAVLSLLSTLIAAPAAAAEHGPKKTPALLEKGKASYQRNCAGCHGEKGAGDGPGAAAINPKPRNFATEAFRNGAKPAQIFATLGAGIAGTAMAPFGFLPEEERWAVAHYVADLKAATSKSSKKK